MKEDCKRCSCPVNYTLSVIGGKWKMVILWYLYNNGVKRYGEINKYLDGITHKTLSNQLKELESSGLINRKEYAQIPPKVEYSITDKGKTLIPILDAMCKWGKENEE
ncbi:MAG: winged helix-turn-helix transcriptional regulator [Peptostreptococcaceae bacterium]